MVVTLHHLDQSRSQRILWLLEELEIPGGYEIKVYKREKGLAPQALKDVHPLGKSPVIDDDGLVIAESGPIVNYLIRTYGNGRFTVPAGDKQKTLDDEYFQHFAEGTVMTQMVIKRVLGSAVEQSPFLARPVARGISDAIGKSYLDPNFEKIFALVDSYLAKDGGRKWLAGTDEPTAADFMMAFPCEVAAGGDRVNPDLISDRVRQYVERFQTRPAYVRALEKGPDYAYGPKNKL